MSLTRIFCQDKTISFLQRSFAADKMAHSYIFAGREGVGKFKTASQWAKVLLCENPATENNLIDSCGTCQSCRLLETDSHPDFINIYKELIQFTRDGKNKKTPVDLPKDVIKEFLIERVSNRPALSKRKVFVVSEAERLNAASQNSLLKVLEEPPAYCTIILLCSRLEKLLPTTRSRCQIIRFGPIGEDRIIEHLKQMGIEAERSRYFARLGQGSLGLACRWAQLELANANLYKTKKELLTDISKYEYPEALQLAEKFLKESKRIAGVWAEIDESTSKTDINRRATKTLIQILISALHDAMKLGTDDGDIINFEQKEQIKRIADRFAPQQAAEKIIDCCKTLVWVNSSVNEKLIFDYLLLSLAISDRIMI